MSLLYSILKPIVKTVVKGSSLHKEESYEEFKQASYDIQRKFKFSLPKIKGFEFRDEMMDGFHVIVGKRPEPSRIARLCTSPAVDRGDGSFRIGGLSGIILREQERSSGYRFIRCCRTMILWTKRSLLFDCMRRC